MRMWNPSPKTQAYFGSIVDFVDFPVRRACFIAAFFGNARAAARKKRKDQDFDAEDAEKTEDTEKD